MLIEKYFDELTSSVHLKQWAKITRKTWTPWNVKLEELDEILQKPELDLIIADLYGQINDHDAFLEIDRTHSKVLQIRNYRVVIVLPPLSDWIELTIVRPVKKTHIWDYNLSEDILEKLTDSSSWILISGAPGQWKTTFAQALIELIANQKKVIKTIESPRDLNVNPLITQYSFSHTHHSELRDILLLSRPDVTIYDEVRNTEDFLLFKDLRLAWVWLIWVIHATNPIDSVQRFLWSIDLWIVSQVVNVVVFIKWWKVEKILTLTQSVKLPQWMASADLARPVIEVKDETWKVVYEIFSFSDQIIVNPIKDMKKTSSVQKFAASEIEYILQNDYWINAAIKIVNDGILKLLVQENQKWAVIWKWGATIQKIEKELWFSIDVETFEEQNFEDYKNFSITNWKKKTILISGLTPSKRYALKIWKEVMYANTSDKWNISLASNQLGKLAQIHWISILDI